MASDTWGYQLFHNNKISDVQVTGLRTLREKITFLTYAIMLSLDFASTSVISVQFNLPGLL